MKLDQHLDNVNTQVHAFEIIDKYPCPGDYTDEHGTPDRPIQSSLTF